jgi:hypothetical protein
MLKIFNNNSNDKLFPMRHKKIWDYLSEISNISICHFCVVIIRNHILMMEAKFDETYFLINNRWWLNDERNKFHEDALIHAESVYDVVRKIYWVSMNESKVIFCGSIDVASSSLFQSAVSKKFCNHYLLSIVLCLLEKFTVECCVKDFFFLFGC